MFDPKLRPSFGAEFLSKPSIGTTLKPEGKFKASRGLLLRVAAVGMGSEAQECWHCRGLAEVALEETEGGGF